MARSLLARWTRQPPGPVRVSARWRSRLPILYSGGLLQSNGGFKAPDSIYSSNAGVQSSAVGVGFRLSGNTADYVRFNTGVTVAATDAYSLQFLVTGSSYPSLAAIVGLSDMAVTNGSYAGASSGGLRAVLSYGGASDPYSIWSWGLSADFDSGVSFQANTPQHIFITSPAGSSRAVSVYRNGVLIASGGAVSYIACGPYFYLGGGHPSRTSCLNGVIALAGYYNVQLSAAEIFALSRNPWGELFEPQRRFIYFAPAAAGGASQSAGVTEGTATAADAVSVTALFAASATEGSGTSLDTSSVAAVFAANAAESGTATDVPSAATITGAAASEGSATAADTESVAALLAASVAESGSAADTQNAEITSTLSGSVAESGAAADTSSVRADFAAAGVESGAGVDTQTSQAAFVAGVTETGIGADTPSAGATYPVAVAEGSASAADASNGTVAPPDLGETAEGSATATDICSATVVFAGSIAEGTASAQDAASAAAVWAAFVAESGSATDTQDWTSGTASSVAEGSNTATDTQDASRGLAGATAEGGAATDFCGATVVYTGSIAEGTASAADLASAQAIFEAAVAESGTLTDSQYGQTPDRGIRRQAVFSKDERIAVYAADAARQAKYTDS